MNSITETAIREWNRCAGVTNICPRALHAMSHDVAYQFHDGNTPPEQVQMLALMILCDLADAQTGNTGNLREHAFLYCIKKPEPTLPDLEDITIP